MVLLLAGNSQQLASRSLKCLAEMRQNVGKASVSLVCTEQLRRQSLTAWTAYTDVKRLDAGWYVVIMKQLTTDDFRGYSFFCLLMGMRVRPVHVHCWIGHGSLCGHA